MTAAKRLVDMVGADGGFDITPADLLPVQLQAANERLQSQIGEIGLLANRAESADVKEIKEPADLVPLLFAHTTYKTYAEGWLNEQRWDRMGKWLATVSTRPVEGLDTDAVKTLDDWIKQLETIGHYVLARAARPASPQCSVVPRATSRSRRKSMSKRCFGPRVCNAVRTANSSGSARSLQPRAKTRSGRR